MRGSRWGALRSTAFRGRSARREKKTLHAAEQDRPDVAAARAAWRNAQPAPNPAQPVFIDETWAKTDMTRTHGRCARGARLVAKAPHGHWKTSPFLAALRHDGIVAPCAIDGAIDGDSFRAYVERFLAPALAPGDIVIMDNLGSHKVVGVSEAVEAGRQRGSSICRPIAPISIPSSRSSAPLKALLRKAAARTIDALWTAIGELLDSFSQEECANYLANVGYLPLNRDML